MGDFVDVYQARNELQRMGRRYLLGLASTQRISKCLISGRPCCLHLHYQGLNFCISEIMGEGCQVEKSAKTEQPYPGRDEISYSLSLMDEIEISPLSPGEKAAEIKVYLRNHVTRSITFLGRVIERRTRERGNNLNDLLVKAVRDYSGYVAEPSTIFLLSL